MNGEDFRTKLREHYLSMDRQARVEVEDDKKMKNACCLKLHLEDHTLGNLTRMALLQQKGVTFAGYRLPHPLQHLVELKIQTNGTIRPEEVFRETVKQLQEGFDYLENEWIRKVQAKEQSQMKEEIL